MTPHEKFISENKVEIESVITRWLPLESVAYHEKYRDVTRWLENFKPSECYLALKLLQHIQYFSDQNIRDYISIAAKQIKKIFRDELAEVLFYPLELSTSSSGSQFLYQYGKELGLKNDNFKSDDFKSHLNRDINIVFFDDIIGSGNQATKFFNKYLKGVRASCHYVSLLGFEHGQNKIRTEAGFKNIVVCKTLYDEYMAFNENSYVFESNEEKSSIRSVCQKYGEKLYPDHPLGYDDSQALIVMPHNTPNNTLPVIWAGPDSESNEEIVWHPVWARKKKLKKEKTIFNLRGAITVNSKFLSTLTNKNFSPYHFYTSKIQGDCQWYGVTQNWDIKRRVEEQMEQRILQSFDVNTDMRVSAVVTGVGGSGKSTLLRRVAANLSSTDITILWIMNADEFHQHTLNKLQENKSRFLVIIEDWYRLSDNSDVLGILLKDLCKVENVRVVIGDRTSENKIYLKNLYMPDKNQYVLNSDENHFLITEIVKNIPEWKISFGKVKQAQDYSYTSLFLLLFIIARNAETNESEKHIDNDLMSQYRAIIQSDINIIAEFEPGIAKALIYWSVLYKQCKIQITETDFCRLADFFEGGSSYQKFFMLDTQDRLNEILRSYITQVISKFQSHESDKVYVLAFNHDTLAEEGLGYSNVAGTCLVSRMTHAKVMEFVLDNFSDHSASILLSFRLSEPNFFKHKQDKIESIKKLEKRHCLYKNHLKYLLTGEDFSAIERQENALTIINEYKFEQLDHSVICHCLRLLKDSELGKSYAMTLLKINNTKKLRPEIICNCLNILKKEGKEYAVYLLESDKKDRLSHSVVCKCLSILRDCEQGRDYSSAFLERCKFEHVNKEIVCNSLNVLSQCEQGKFYSNALLERNINDPLERDVICSCLRNLSGTVEGKNHSIALLERNINDPLESEIVCSCLRNLTGTVEGKNYAIALLDWDEKDRLSDQLLSSCLGFLKENTKAKDYVVHLLSEENWRTLNWNVVYKSLKILASFMLETTIISEIIDDYYRDTQDRTAKNRYFNILKIPFYYDEKWEIYAQNHLDNWQGENRVTLINILEAYEGQPAKTEMVCHSILKRWRKEFDFQLNRFSSIRIWQHINIAINHPNLESIGKKSATDIIAYNAENPDKIPAHFIEHCKKRLT